MRETTMRAWQIPAFGIDKLEIGTRPVPEPGIGEVLIRIRAVSLNFRDLMMVAGKYNPKLQLPRIPCSDGAGEVMAIGQGVTRVRVGDRVAGIFMQNWIGGLPAAEKQHGALGGDVDGMLSEYVALPEQGVVIVPQHLSDEEAATLPCAAVTAWNAVVHAGATKPGDTIVIQGTGGVSLFALQFALLAGARVLGTSGDTAKLDRARALGLAAGVSYREHADWAAWALEQTDGQGAQLVVEVGGAGTFSQSLKAVAVGGTIAQIGVLSQGAEPTPIVPILHKQVKVQGIYVGSRENFEEMNRAISHAQLKPVVDQVFAFKDAPQAFRRMETGAHFGKIVIRVD